MDELRRHLVERLRVVGDDRPVADGAHDVGRAARLAGQDDLVAGARRSARGRRRRTARPPGPPAARRRASSSSSGSALRSMSVPARTSAPTVVVGTLRRRGLVLAEDLLQAAQRVAQLELAEDVAQPRPVGRRRRLGGDVDVHRDVAPDRRELLRHAREVGVLGEVLLALGARDVVDVREHALEVAPLLQELRRGLVADAGDAGDVVARVALEPVEVGDELGRDAVALDDRLVVVHLRLGDPAARRHDLHDAVGVDELERVAVAGDDDRRDRRIPPRARARRSTR